MKCGHGLYELWLKHEGVGTDVVDSKNIPHGKFWNFEVCRDHIIFQACVAHEVIEFVWPLFGPIRRVQYLGWQIDAVLGRLESVHTGIEDRDTPTAYVFDSQDWSKARK